MSERMPEDSQPADHEQLEQSPPAGAAPDPPEAPPLEPVPWDTPGMALVPAFKQTLVACLTKPFDFFQRVPLSEDRWSAIGFAVLMHLLGFGVAAAWLAVFGSPNTMLALVRAALAPIWVLVFVWIGAELMHGILDVFEGARFSRSVTHRAVAFCYATAILGVIPKFGLLVGLVASAVYHVIALRQAHRAATWQAVVAVIGAWVLILAVLGLMAYPFE